MRRRSHMWTWSRIAAVFWKNTDAVSPELKRRGTISAQFKRGYISVYGTGSTHIWTGTVSAERCIQVLEQPIFFREGLAYFSKTMLNCTLHLLQQHGFIIEESGFWTGLPAVQTFHQCKPWSIIKRKIQQRRSWTVEQLESYIRHNGSTFLCQKSNNWSLQFPDCW